MVIETLQRICALQPEYSSENTPAMQARSELIRRTLPDEIRHFQAELVHALGPFGAEFDIGASDGIGRKTEAPWVRFFAKSMSPTPREGFYVVLHFAADGSAVFVTVGCGSTIWANGDLRSESDEELARRTAWARRVIRDRFGTTAPFDDEIKLGAKAALPRTFEKATAVAKRLPVNTLDEGAFIELLRAAAERLEAIYAAQREGRHLSNGDQVALQLETLSRPNGAAAQSQGFGLTGPERRAVELRAMELARNWLEAAGYTVKDTSRTACFDFEARKDGQILKIEVKGTTADSADAIFMTRNEVELHSKEAGLTGLILVSKIRLRHDGPDPLCDGGELLVELGWDIGDWEAAPIAYRLTRTPAA